jgi:putative endonuclease
MKAGRHPKDPGYGATYLVNPRRTVSAQRQFYVYVLSSRSRTLYVGVTNNLARRVREHKEQTASGFTSKYHVSQLVHFEVFPTARDAIAREKQLKSWRRVKKVKLISRENPKWRDLSEDEGFFDPLGR